MATARATHSQSELYGVDGDYSIADVLINRARHCWRREPRRSCNCLIVSAVVVSRADGTKDSVLSNATIVMYVWFALCVTQSLSVITSALNQLLLRFWLLPAFI